jgi:hypothetical protein
MNVDLNSGWDYWPVMGEQVEELRRRYNILPAEAFLPESHGIPKSRSQERANS